MTNYVNKLPPGWRGVLATLNSETTDGRSLLLENGKELKTRTMPLPLKFRVPDKIYSSFEVAGTIERAWVSESFLLGVGLFDLNSLAGVLAAAWLHYARKLPLEIDVTDVTGLPGNPLSFTDWSLEGAVLSRDKDPVFPLAYAEPIYGHRDGEKSRKPCDW